MQPDVLPDDRPWRRLVPVLALSSRTARPSRSIASSAPRALANWNGWRLLVLIRRMDACSGHEHYGCSTLAQYLELVCGITGTAARERIRVAFALEVLPQIEAAFARGELSYSKVRAVGSRRSHRQPRGMRGVMRRTEKAARARSIRRRRRPRRGRIRRRCRPHGGRGTGGLGRSTSRGSSTRCPGQWSTERSTRRSTRQ